MKIHVYIVSHKNIKFPKLNGYQPIQVGNANNNFSGYIRDNTNDNIANKNNNYCELTAQYWIWKNEHSDIKGLVHYRRFFSNSRFNLHSKIPDHVINENKLKKYFNHYDLILPRKRHYYIETSWSHYIHAHESIGLTETKQVIAKYYPEYLNEFNITMSKRSAHMFNMMIARSSVFDSYSKWLFGVLSKVENNLDISKWSKSEKRIYGYLSELLLDVWLRKHNNLKYKELPVMFIGNQHWGKKIINFIYRKFDRG